MSERLFIEVRYDIEADFVHIESNIKAERQGEVVTDFIHSQVGAGKDETPAEKRGIYTIRLELELADDTFYVSHDCGNKGLRDGILMRVLRDLS